MKELIFYLRYQHSISENFEDIGKWIAWLEKQGEQILANSAKTCKDEPKPADKVEPRFKVSDWVVYENRVGLIIRMLKEHYIISFDGVEEQVSFIFNDRIAKWTIQDAKDGDVLACENGWTCIFKTLVNDETFSSYCFMDNTEWFCETGSECHTLREEFIKAYNGKIHPATKEERDLLFQKMHEAGYEWDAEKKELKKIEQKPAAKYKVGDTVYYDSFGRLVSFVIANIVEDGTDNPMYEDKDGNSIFQNDIVELKPDEIEKGANGNEREIPNSAWSEEDEKMCTATIFTLAAFMGSEDKIDWLKSLKDRIKGE